MILDHEGMKGLCMRGGSGGDSSRLSGNLAFLWGFQKME